MSSLNKASQVLLVDDVQRTKEYYMNQLGFTIDGQFVERDNVSFLIKEIEDKNNIRPNHTINGFMESYIWVDNVDDLHQEFKSKGAKLEEPITQSYGMRDFIVYDPDGYRFCFASLIEY